ncbi:MAG: DNA primase [Candidatus Saccharibacteria bacterium]|nr:DNA primase [Candidatus Saccharibacteria bacterium]
MEEAKEEIKARLSVEDVVGQYIELKRAGRTLKGRSPWGVDKTPSFMVSPEKGIWHDFSANKGGDIFTFIMEVEGIPFREAMEKLAAQAGVELKKYSAGDKKIAQVKARAREALELSTKYYQICLTKNKPVCEYVFYKRNLNRKTVVEFRIGYSPQQGEALKNFLTKKGYNQRELEAAGLLNRFGGDMFRGRMMVPFIDTNNGAVIGYTARILDQGEPKYLNTPDTLLFNKSRYIFGLYQAKEAIRREGFVVIVEGNMDVISSHQAGVKQAVATSGTAMTEQHLKILSRLTSDIRLAYDGDEAGVKATERAINLAGGLGVNLTVISNYHGAKDPDELIQKDAELWQAAVNERKPAVEWLLDKYEEKLDLTTGPGKKEFSDVAMRVIAYLKDPVERKHYEQIVAKRIDVDVADLVAKKVDFEKKPKRLKTVKNSEKGTDVLRGVEDNLLAIMLYGGEAGTKVNLELPEDEARLLELEMVYENRYKGWGNSALEKEVKGLMTRREEEIRKVRIAELTEKLEKANDDEANDILREIMKLNKGL